MSEDQPTPPNPYQPTPPTPYQPAPPTPYQPAPAAPTAWGQPQPGSLASVEANFGPVASFGDRVLAYLIDLAIALVAVVPVVLGFVLLVLSAPTSATSDPNGIVQTSGGSPGQAIAGVVLIVLGYGLGFAIQLWNRVFRMGRRGQSIGKSRMNLMLIDARTGQPIGAGMCFLRELVGGIVNQLVFLSSLWMLWDPDRQTLADKTVTSTVITLPRR